MNFEVCYHCPNFCRVLLRNEIVGRMFFHMILDVYKMFKFFLLYGNYHNRCLTLKCCNRTHHLCYCFILAFRFNILCFSVKSAKKAKSHCQSKSRNCRRNFIISRKSVHKLASILPHYVRVLHTLRQFLF